MLRRQCLRGAETCFPDYLSLIQDQDSGFGTRHHAGMARFFFNLHELGSVLVDEEGANFPNADAARANAFREARQLMAADVSDGALCLASHIEVQDEERNTLLIVVFKDAIVLSGFTPSPS